jgi:hypothetical protein
VKRSRLHVEWSGSPASHFRTGVSLHGHTLHSKETLGFLYKLARGFAPFRSAIAAGEKHYQRVHGSELDLNRAWWTPPLAPEEAWLLEKRQIEDRLALRPLVSLTDHDDVEAHATLRHFAKPCDAPVSTEWTVPYGPTFFHLGVHNLPAERLPEFLQSFARVTRSHGDVNLVEVLESLSNLQEVLIVFNHPCWDEKAIGQDLHRRYALQFARAYKPYIHALELNGLRRWRENKSVLAMARELDLPVVSGGDRHALEPNAIVDLSNASHFAEYVSQVRCGYSDVLILNQYREPFVLRILQSLEEILGEQANHRRGWHSWNDRVFYHCDDGEVRSLAALAPSRLPGIVPAFVKSISLIRKRSMCRTFRSLFPRQREFAW